MRGISVSVILVIAHVCAGCSYLDMSVASDQPEWNKSHPLAKQTPARLRAERLARALAAARAHPIARTGDYMLGTGDVLAVGVFALEEPGTTTTLTCAVGHDGKIALPWVGSLSVKGLTARQAADTVRAAYADKYLKNPQVTVSVAEHRSSAVVVTGAVNTPGVYPLEHNVSTVLELLALAGGTARGAANELLLLRGGNEVIPIDLTELIDAGNLALNLQVRDGDILTVPPQVKQYIYVLGYVQRPGVFELRDGTAVDALRAVACGGGVSATARVQNSYVIREGPDGQKTIPVDLRKMGRGELPTFHMQSGDTLVVGTTAWARMCEFFRPSVGASVSASASAFP